VEIAVIILIAIVIIVIMLAGQNKKVQEEILVKYSYLSKKQIMTNAEKVFYDKLLATLGNDHYIVPQAHLSMFIDHKIKGQNWKGAFSVINGKSVDFLIVEKTTQKPVLAIELDDYTHARPDRVKRDAVVVEILNRAGVPLQRYASNGQIPTFDAILATTGNPETLRTGFLK
jgi:hypothetical protein